MAFGIGFGVLASSGGGSSPPPYTANAVDFDGSTNYLSRASDFTGNADSSQFLISIWFRIDSGDGTQREIYNSGTAGTGFEVYIASSNQIAIDCYNSSGASEFAFTTTTTFTAGSSWNNVLLSGDTNFSAGNKLHKVAVNGSSESAANVTDSQGAFNINFTNTAHAVGASTSGTGKWNGCLAEIYIATGQYLDVSNSTNISKFISGGKPVNLGSDGSTPTGTAPILYLKGNAAGIATNSGTGGNMTANGSFNNCSTSPSS